MDILLKLLYIRLIQYYIKGKDFLNYVLKFKISKLDFNTSWENIDKQILIIDLDIEDESKLFQMINSTDTLNNVPIGLCRHYVDDYKEYIFIVENKKYFNKHDLIYFINKAYKFINSFIKEFNRWHIN